MGRARPSKRTAVEKSVNSSSVKRYKRNDIDNHKKVNENNLERDCKSCSTLGKEKATSAATEKEIKTNALIMQHIFGTTQIPDLSDCALKCLITENFKPLLVKLSQDIPPEAMVNKEIKELQIYEDDNDKNLIRVIVKNNLCLLVILLVVNGFPVDSYLDENMETFLNIASQNGHMEIVNFLLSNGADVNKIDNCGMTPLHYAVKNSHLNVIKMLVDSGANVNAKTDCGFTPLHLACMNERSDIIEYLLLNGSDVGIKNKLNKTAFDYVNTVSNLKLLRKYLV